VSTTAAELKIKSQVDGLNQFIFSQIAFYVLIGGVVFVVPSFSETMGPSMVKTTTALLFVIGAISSVVQSIPMLAAASAAAENITKIEEMLQGAARMPDEGALESPKPFRRIEMYDVSFHYVDLRSDEVFRIGPINFTLEAGEVVFISGGNGSGKSTFLKVLTGLYPPDTGKIFIDGEEVGDHNRDTYRTRFTAIFSDYHLFKRLYGIATVDPEEVSRLLALFELTRKTRLVDGEFTTTADQDPDFRRKFYDELVPSLQQSGKTIVAVSHDDRYLGELKTPARQLRMEDGRIVTPPQKGG
jgi:putative ATP-binding cassette transporter